MCGFIKGLTRHTEYVTWFFMKNVAEIIKDFRVRYRLSQTALARLLEVKVYNLSKYERKKTVPSANFLLKLQELERRAFKKRKIRK